jgi:translation elongation factor P/translation initiation factor 5A
MDDLEKRLEEQLEYLYKMRDKYQALNQRTKYKYDWRQRGIEEHISALEHLRNNEVNSWNECYEEDCREVE